MLNKFDALRYFCVAAETLNFRETANRLSVSPSVITRVVNELEAELGEQLFKRHTRSIKLTSFGEQFLLRAQHLLAESETLFKMGKNQADDLAGIVRITVPSWRNNDEIIRQLLITLESYPEIIIDWREDMGKLDMVEDRIDMGLRIGLEPDQDFVVRKITEIGDVLVASPALVKKLGQPTDLTDFERRYPMAIPINSNTGKPWTLFLNEDITLNPKNPAFYSVDNYSALQAVLLGKCAGLINDFMVKPYLEFGELIQLFPEIQIDKWQLFLYRPYQTVTPARVLKVFDLLTEILRKTYY
ncbi:LysR family transcriptional regulator [[Mannheimia] succiniciproducens]|uniref:LysR protein n=1 Tax=Mannheimia succiniciproducens (strain KCTC 0769BP / MBEL55E) TaxID=221988 RepID=Q65QM3_MANSM|nr:LysR family transcriptional regulator [[Mannheimia] succiniciproducens]AAU38737.1 LysR protein [[Mannheimia] succiniciproducens MBEL55E]